jgi:hypothetical protein
MAPSSEVARENAMGKRYVDADILDDLSRHARRTRDDLADLLHKCEGRVKILPQRGWNLGTWGDVFNSVKHEATSLDDHARELVDRAARVREAARERVLQELRELWAAIAGLREKIEAEANWLKKFWEKWQHPGGKWPFPWPKPPWPKPPWPWPLPPWILPGPKPPWPPWPWPTWPWPIPPIPLPPIPLPPWWPRHPAPEPQPPPPTPVPPPPVAPTPPTPPTPPSPPKVTAQDIAAWALGQQGHPYTQCVQLIADMVRAKFPGKATNFGYEEDSTPYDQWKLTQTPGGNSHIFEDSNTWEKISKAEIDGRGGFKEGDIVIMYGSSAPVGHVGIVTKTEGGLWIMDANWGEVPSGKALERLVPDYQVAQIVGVYRLRS